MYFEIPGTSIRVLGSLHMFPAGGAGMPPWVNEAYQWCESLVHEHELAAVLPYLKGDAPLQQRLKPATWDALIAALPSDQARDAFSSFHPWAAMIALPSVFQATEPGVEQLLLARAAADGKPTAQLETGEDLCRGFGAAPLATVEDCIDQVLLDPGQMQPRLQAMYDAWTARDRDALLAAAEASGAFSDPALRDAGLLSRNRAWAPKVRRLMASSRRTLVVVGAMHLCGTGNLEECLGVGLVPVPVAA